MWINALLKTLMHYFLFVSWCVFRVNLTLFTLTHIFPLLWLKHQASFIKLTVLCVCALPQEQSRGPWNGKALSSVRHQSWCIMNGYHLSCWSYSDTRHQGSIMTSALRQHQHTLQRNNLQSWGRISYEGGATPAIIISLEGHISF